jgi:hypothetical protein
MRKKQKLDDLLLKFLSKKSAERIMAKTNRMAKTGASPAKIQHAIIAMIAAECEDIIVKGVRWSDMAKGTGVTERRV